MIVDCFTHTWESAEQLGRGLPPFSPVLSPSAARPDTANAAPARHAAAAEPVDVTLVLGFKSRYLQAEISNDWVAAYVRRHPQRFIGIAGIDPSEPREAIAELRRARDELSMPAAAVAPPSQDFHPSDSKAMLVYAEAAERGMSVIFHGGVYISGPAKLEYARPLLLDEIARELPTLKMVVARMGWPWTGETIELLSKHRHVYAEISGLVSRPWQAYQTLLMAHQSGVIDKLLFGSGFPSAIASTSIEELYSINHLVHGTHLPPIPREQIRAIVERDALTTLGIPWTKPAEVLAGTPAGTDDEGDEITT